MCLLFAEPFICIGKSHGMNIPTEFVWKKRKTHTQDIFESDIYFVFICLVLIGRLFESWHQTTQGFHNLEMEISLTQSKSLESRAIMKFTILTVDLWKLPVIGTCSSPVGLNGFLSKLTDERVKCEEEKNRKKLAKDC